MSAPVRVLIVDDHPVVRRGLRSFLETHPELEVVGEAADGKEALRMVATGQPDLVLLDLHLPDATGSDLIPQMREWKPGVRVLVLTGFASRHEVVPAIQAGADGYLLKDLSAEALSLSLLLVMRGEKALPSSLASVLADDPRTGAAHGASIKAQKHLTEREQQILRCLLNAYSNKHIARALNISEGTVKVHLKSLMKKIAAGNRTQAALWARNNGIANGELTTGGP